jgi:hypothetical protein
MANGWRSRRSVAPTPRRPRRPNLLTDRTSHADLVTHDGEQGRLVLVDLRGRESTARAPSRQTTSARTCGATIELALRATDRVAALPLMGVDPHASTRGDALKNTLPCRARRPTHGSRSSSAGRAAWFAIRCWVRRRAS